MGLLRNRQIVLFAGIIFACQIVTNAQAGRHPTNPTTTTPSVAGPKAIEKPTSKPPRLQLLVGIDTRDPMSNIPSYISDGVLDNCVRRLGDAAEVIATSAGNDLDRAKAIRRAKDEKERFVVWLHVGSDFENSAKQSKNGPDELYVSYTIFEPVTAKVRQSGKSSRRIYKTGQGGVLSPSRNGPIYSEYALKQAAQDAAERILEAFEIKLRDDGLPD